MDKAKIRKGYAFVVAGSVCLGMLGIAGRILYAEIDTPITPGAFIFFNEHLAAQQVVGGVLVPSGAVGVQWEERRQRGRRGGEVPSKQ